MQGQVVIVIIAFVGLSVYEFCDGVVEEVKDIMIGWGLGSSDLEWLVGCEGRWLDE